MTFARLIATAHDNIRAARSRPPRPWVPIVATLAISLGVMSINRYLTFQHEELDSVTKDLNHALAQLHVANTEAGNRAFADPYPAREDLDPLRAGRQGG